MTSGSDEGSPPKWIALAGPTASGKTALSLAIAARWPVEIISVDSALVYRGMDIGTAKPSAAERARVPHHLIDILEPEEAYSAARFVEDANRLIDEIRARGRWPLLVGGTMMYFKAFMDGLDRLPAADPQIRAALDAEAAARGWPAMHAELAAVDPVTAARLKPMDSQRIQRALEVWRSAGVPLSSLHTRDDGEPAGRRDGVLISLEPDDRSWLHARIAQRFDAMIEAGFLDEVRTLRQRRPALQPTMPSMRCVGYRQAWEALDEAEARATPDRVDTALLKERGIAATRQLAKRQITWLRSMPQRLTAAADRSHVSTQVLEVVRQSVPEALEADRARRGR
jgi:tRNA dimethylallyltransferase